MKTYAFDIKLWAVARVTARNENEAREKLATLDCIGLNYDARDDVKLTEASIEDDGGMSELFEIDGKEVS